MIVLEQEKQILKKVKKGDNEAFGELYDFYAPKVYRFVRLKVDCQETAQDLTSEAFLKIWEYLQEQKRIRERFRSLLYKIARNLVIDFYRAKSNREILIDELEELSHIEDDQRSDELALRREDMKEVKQGLAKIKSNYQDVIIWYYIEDMPISEIADILDKKEGTVRVLIHRAKEALKEVVEE